MRCANCLFRTPICPPKGPVDSPFVIVGESPGINEIVERAPFVGESGILLDEVLKRQGYTEGTHGVPYYTNSVMCLPQQKDPEKLAAATLRCRGRLFDEIRSYPRKVILALGTPALQTLTGDPSLRITRDRGKVWKTDLADFMVSAVHPAFLLRGGGSLQQFERDIAYALNLLEDGADGLKLPNGTTFHVAETEAEVIEFSRLLKSKPQGYVVAADIETTGFHHVKDEILELGIHYAPQTSIIIPASLIAPELFENDCHWVWHHGKFDCKFIRRHYQGASPRTDGDTMLLSYTLNERRGFHDLDQCASDWLGSPNHKWMVSEYYKGKVWDEKLGRKRQRNLSDAPPALRRKYLALDISDTYELYNHLRPMVAADPHLERYYTKTLLPASDYLLKVEMNGMHQDNEWVEDNDRRLSKILERCDFAFNRLAEKSGYRGGWINMNSWQQIKPFIYGHLKLGPLSLGTDEDTLKTLKPIISPFGLPRRHLAIQLLMRQRKFQKQRGTYVLPMKKKVTIYGQIHPTFKLAATATGRLASEDPNAQNIPRDPRIRGQFTPRPGYAILEVDYSQAELRCLAQLSGCPDLCAIFEQGKDLHVEMSKYLFGDNFTKEEKMATKTVNFGIVYGRTARSIADDPDLSAKMDITVELAQSWIDGWARRFPVAWEFIQKCRMAPLKNQTLTTVFGNKKRPGVVNYQRLFEIQNESANFFHQSIASNINLHAGIKMFETLRDEYDTHVINLVHDCHVTETPFEKFGNYDIANAHVRKVAQYMKEVMEREATLWGFKRIPFKVEPEFGFRWGNVLKFTEIDKMYGGRFENVPDYIAPH